MKFCNLALILKILLSLFFLQYHLENDHAPVIIFLLFHP